MNCEELKIGLHDYVDGAADDFVKREIDKHLRTCDKCFNEYKKIKIFRDKIKALPDLQEPSATIIQSLSSTLLEKSLQNTAIEEPKISIKKVKKESAQSDKNSKEKSTGLSKNSLHQSRLPSEITQAFAKTPRVNWLKIFLSLLPLLIIVGGYFYYDFQKNNAPWNIRIMEGQAAISGKLNHKNLLPQDASLFTHDSSRAIIQVPLTGNIQVLQNTLLILEKGKEGDNKIALNMGSITVENISDMPSLSIALKNSVIYDRAGKFSVNVDELENAQIFVERGFVEIIYSSVKYFVCEGYICDVLKDSGPGIPYRKDSSDSLKNEIKHFNNNAEDEKSLDKIISLAKIDAADALTLLALILKAPQIKRQEIFQEITNHFPPPPGIIRADIVNADKNALYLWWQEIEWQL